LLQFINKGESKMTSPHVKLQRDGILIHGEALVLLTSSLFYFRIPAFEWRSRMRTLRALGYNAIDVYFPWNYHELAPGQWDFSGERDVRAFLQAASEEQLWVVARPGPYICSEWDGGALPAYLNTIPGMKLRDNNPQFLQAVKEWFDRILPIVAGFQVDRGGTVIMLQLDNELDFYDCTDRPGYMTALRDMALGHGITVPLIACSGQGDIPGATGNVEGVVPTCNMYFDARDPLLEPRVRYYAKTLRERSFPLCITETNRSHTDLRRLLAGGAKLLGPYLQTSGTEFGFTTSVTNWGDPLSFMTSHYDFGGMITPAGKVRPDGREALVFSKMIRALGSALALSESVDAPPQPVHGVDAAALALKGGGWLAALPNPGEKTVDVCFGDDPGRFPLKTKLTVDPATCPFILLDCPLVRWGIDAKIAYSTIELMECVDTTDTLELTFAIAGSAEIVLQGNISEPENVQGWQIESISDGWLLWSESDLPAAVQFISQYGKKVIVKGVSREEVGSLEKAGLEEWQISPLESGAAIQNIDWRLNPLDPCDPGWFNHAQRCQTDALHLEQNHIYRGFGWYGPNLPSVNDGMGFLLHSAGDILSVYLDGDSIGTLVPRGGDSYLPLPEGVDLTESSRLVICAEIWGHANFDDHRLPSLRLNALRGMDGMTVIQKVENLTPNWHYQHQARSLAGEIDPAWPVLSFGGWSTTDEPSQGIYYRDVNFAPGMDRRILSFPGLQVNTHVFIDGQSAGTINPFNPFMDISSLCSWGKLARIAMIVDQPFRRSAGEVILYQGNQIQDWELAGWGESELADLTADSSLSAEPVKLPLALSRGKMAWLHADLPLSVDWERGWGLQLLGQGMKVSAWLGNRLVGRIWLPSEVRPRMTGGLDDRMVLPSAWLRQVEGKLHLLLESLTSQTFGELCEIKLIQDV
jgi:beta-galactosidase